MYAYQVSRNSFRNTREGGGSNIIRTYRNARGGWSMCVWGGGRGGNRGRGEEDIGGWGRVPHIKFAL